MTPATNRTPAPRRPWLLAAAFVPAAMGCTVDEGKSGASPRPPETGALRAFGTEAAARDACDAASASLGKELLGALSRSLAQGPPEGALDACAGMAQTLTARIAAEHGLSLRRTALRVRNPENAPDALEREVLTAWAAPGAEPASVSRTVAIDGGGLEVRVLRPILLGGLCVTCHGAPEEIPPAVRDALARRYPEDRATGFRAGELRGAFSARARVR